MNTLIALLFFPVYSQGNLNMWGVLPATPPTPSTSKWEPENLMTGSVAQCLSGDLDKRHITLISQSKTPLPSTPSTYIS